MDSCAGGICSHTPNDAACNDNDACTGLAELVGQRSVLPRRRQHPPTSRQPPHPFVSAQGEIRPADRLLVPAPEEPPSKEFLEQLREFTSWRMQAEGGEDAPAVASHLGAKKKRSGGAAR